MKAVWYIPAEQAAVTAELRVKTMKLGENADKRADPRPMIGANLNVTIRP